MLKQAKANLKYIFILILGIIAPLFLWILKTDISYLFSGYYPTLSAVGKISGLTGISLLAISLILSGKYIFLDRFFGGIDKIYRLHSNLGKIAFTLIIIHFAAVSFRLIAFSLNSAVKFIFSISTAPLNLGKISFIGFIIIISLTIFISQKIKYETLFKIHKTLGIFFLLGALHAFLMPSDLSFNKPLKWYIFSLTVLALLVYVESFLGKQFNFHRKIYSVAQVSSPNKDVTEITLLPKKGRINFQPGQFIFIAFKQKGFPFEEHPFSISSGNKENELKISVKALGDFTSRLPELKLGTEALLRGPFGSFVQEKQEKDQIWIAGGIGVTPFLSMARSLENQKNNPNKIQFFYSVKEKDEQIFLEELQNISKKNTLFSFIPWVSRERGRLDAKKIKQMTRIKNKEIFICGPPLMLKSFLVQFKNLGIKKNKLHFEKFSLL